MQLIDNWDKLRKLWTKIVRKLKIVTKIVTKLWPKSENCDQISKAKLQ